MKKKQIVRTYCKKKEDRNDKDCYLTPISIIKQLLEKEKFDKNKRFLECCSNKEKHIEKILIENGYNNVESNVYENDGIDFLKWNENKKYDYIISNTPYKNANDFIIKCMKVSTEKICLFFPLDYCNGINRYENVFNNKLGWKLSTMYVFVRKVMLEKSFIDKKGIYYRTGLGCYCWYIFEKNYTDNTKIIWIDNNKYVLGSRDCNFRYDNKNKKVISK
tara:strand:- start:3119 stop:3775 length:657 start_codon:yes stop_codon:yes gene_type:complete